MGIRYETLGQFPNHRRILIADTEAELLAATPATEVAEGYAKDTGINADYVQGSGWKVGGATKNPDGSTSLAGLLRVGGGVVADGFSSCAVTLNSIGSADTNLTAIQAALDQGGSVRIDGNGVLYISGTIVIGNGGPTSLVVSDGITIRATTGRSLIINKAFSNVAKAVSAATYASNVISVACTAHGFAVGQYVSIQGETTGGYNGPAEVLSTPTADSFTLRANIQRLAAAAAGTILAVQCDPKISISGGIWDRAEITGLSALDKMALKFCHVRGLDIECVTVAGSDKYGILAGDYWKATASKIEFQTNSDGIHFQGPGGITSVSDVSGTVGDNLVAFTIGDYSDYEVSVGDFDNIEISSVRGIVKNNFDMIRFVGKPGYFFRNIQISGVTQGAYPIVSIQTDTNLAQTNIRNFRMVNCEQRGSGRMVQIQKGIGACAVDRISISCRGEAMSASILYIGDGNTIGSVEIDGEYSFIAGSLPVYCRSAVKRMRLKGLFSGVTTVDFITAEDAASITDLEYDGARIENFKSILLVAATGTVANIRCPRLTCQGMNNGITLRSVANIFIGEVSGSSSTYEFIRNSVGSSIATIYPYGRLVWDKASLYLASGATARVNGSGAPVDASIVTVRTAGDILHNSNAALGCGVGPAMWTGAAWQNLATGALYTP